MSYYHTPTATERNPGRLETKLSDGAKLSPPDTGWTPTLAALCGFVVVVQVAKPADTATDTFDRSVTLPAGVPTVTWTQRPWTAGELADRQATVNRSAITTNLAQDMADIQLIIDSTNASINSNPAVAIKALARMMRRLGRFAVNDLTGTT
jgi:hypothetical protein